MVLRLYANNSLDILLTIQQKQLSKNSSRGVAAIFFAWKFFYTEGNSL